nr:immunoglobulin heavy chain junction region [Mus musculus]
ITVQDWMVTTDGFTMLWP